MDEPTPTGFKPPYLSFQTLWSFVRELSEKPLPPSIDRSMLDKKSGTDQANLLAALKSLGLVEGDQHRVLEPLQTLVKAEEDERKYQLAAIVRQFYPGQMAVSDQNGTEKSLIDSFETDFGFTGDTRRKAVTFFLHAARHAGIPLSPHFPSTRSGSGTTAGTKPKRTTKRKPEGTFAGRSQTAPARTGTGDPYTVTLKSGGQVSIIVSVNIFELSNDDRTFVIELVDKMKGYASTNVASEAGDA
jgi:hypothetical protein